MVHQSSRVKLHQLSNNCYLKILFYYLISQLLLQFIWLSQCLKSDNLRHRLAETHEYTFELIERLNAALFTYEKGIVAAEIL